VPHSQKHQLCYTVDKSKFTIYSIIHRTRCQTEFSIIFNIVLNEQLFNIVRNSKMRKNSLRITFLQPDILHRKQHSLQKSQSRVKSNLLQKNCTILANSHLCMFKKFTEASFPTKRKLTILTTCQTNSLENIRHNRQNTGMNQAQFNKIRSIQFLNSRVSVNSKTLARTIPIYFILSDH